MCRTPFPDRATSSLCIRGQWRLALRASSRLLPCAVMGEGGDIGGLNARPVLGLPAIFLAPCIGECIKCPLECLRWCQPLFVEGSPMVRVNRKLSRLIAVLALHDIFGQFINPAIEFRAHAPRPPLRSGRR